MTNKMISQSKQNKSATDCFRGQQPEYRTVIFIPAIPGSDLAARIRRIEMYNTKGRKFRVRIVEKSGQDTRGATRNVIRMIVSCVPHQ